MNVRFSSVFKRDLLEAETRYATISDKLGDDPPATTRPRH